MVALLAQTLVTRQITVSGETAAQFRGWEGWMVATLPDGAAQLDEITIGMGTAQGYSGEDLTSVSLALSHPPAAGPR